MGIESEEGLLKSDGVVPKRSSGSALVPRERRSVTCRARRKQ
jgi:hypothetical protein